MVPYEQCDLDNRDPDLLLCRRVARPQCRLRGGNREKEFAAFGQSARNRSARVIANARERFAGRTFIYSGLSTTPPDLVRARGQLREMGI